MKRKYKVTGLEVKGPGISKRLHNLKECEDDRLIGLVQDGLVILPNKLEDMLDEAYNEGIKANQSDIKKSLGL